MPQRNRSIDALTVRHFLAVARKFRGEFALSWLTSVSALGMGIGIPYVTGRILANLAHPSFPIARYIWALIIITLVSVLTNRISYGAFFRLQPKVMAYLQEEALVALLKRSASFHNNRVSGKLASDAVDYPSSFSQLSNTLLIDALPLALTIVIGIALVAIKSPLIGLILLLMTALAIGSAIYFRHHMTPYRIKRHAAAKAVTAHLADTIVNNQTVKAFAGEDRELAVHRTLGQSLMAARLHDWVAVANDGANRILGLLVFQTLFIVLLVQQVHTHPNLLATGIFAFSYTMTISNRLFQIGTMMRSTEEALLLAMPITEMLQEQVEIVDAPGAKELHVSKGSVDVEHVTFHYHDNPQQDAVFSDLNLHIKPGEKIGLVGPSGGGKTTLTKLLLRFEDISEGSIQIDGQDIDKVTQASLRRAIAYVPQESLLFHRTIRENIAYGQPNANQEAIEQAAKLAYADDFIRQLPNGYDTVVGERGVKLSGGQRQRVAIARAILKDAPVLLLDEATSALDSESEIVIQSALWELMQNRTAIVVAHRLSTIQKMDRIIVLNNGRIVEEGPHQQLLEANGLYARLWNHQSGGFIEE